MALNFHEDLRRPAEIRPSSNRHFGLVLALVFAVLGLWPPGHVRAPAIAVASAFLMVSLIRPAFLHSLNRAWTMLGLLLGRIVNLIVTAVLFFLVFTPIGILSRLLGKDPLRLKLMPGVHTYWITRQPPGPQRETMSKQF